MNTLSRDTNMVNLKKRRRMINIKFTTVVSLRAGKGMGLGQGNKHFKVDGNVLFLKLLHGCIGVCGILILYTLHIFYKF